MKPLFEELQELGFDYEKTLPRFLKNEEFYISCLKELLEEEDYVELGELLEQEDIAHAFEVAHGLKGITANMGIADLETKLGVLVENLRVGQKEKALPLYNELMQTKRKLDEIIRHER